MLGFVFGFDVINRWFFAAGGAFAGGFDGH
jgi:hypothetical protein